MLAGCWGSQRIIEGPVSRPPHDVLVLSHTQTHAQDILLDQQVAGTLDTHAKDIEDLIAMFPRPPVVIAHSFGGLILQKYLLGMADGSSGSQGYARLAGAAFLCSVPPSGGGFCRLLPPSGLIPVWYYITPYSEVCPSAHHLCSCPRVGPAP